MWQISHPLQLVQVWVAIFVSKIGLQPLFTRLTSLNLCRIDHGQPGTRPPSCATPRQMTMYFAS